MRRLLTLCLLSAAVCCGGCTEPRQPNSNAVSAQPSPASDVSSNTPLPTTEANDPPKEQIDSSIPNEPANGHDETDIGNIDDTSAATLSWLKQLSAERFGNLTSDDLRTITKLDLSWQGPNIGTLQEAFQEWCASITDEDLKRVRTLKSLTELNLHSLHITDQGLTHLKSLKRLEKLDIGGTKITDDGLKSLADLTSLQDLDLTYTGISGAGLESIRGLKLKALRFQYASIADESLKHLKSMTSLRELDLSYTSGSVTDKGLEELKGLTALTSLNLDHATGCTDAGLSHLRDMRLLTDLNLSGDYKITDQGMKHLEALKSLKNLNVSLTKVSNQGVRALKNVLPNCAITK